MDVTLYVLHMLLTPPHRTPQTSAPSAPRSLAQRWRLETAPLADEDLPAPVSRAPITERDVPRPLVTATGSDTARRAATRTADDPEEPDDAAEAQRASDAALRRWLAD